MGRGKGDMEWGCNRQSDHTLNDISSVLVSFLCVQSAAVPVEEGFDWVQLPGNKGETGLQRALCRICEYKI